MSNLISGAEILIKSLLEEGVDTIFGYPGGNIISVFDELYDYLDKFKYILARHEQGATHAAQGYARISGKPGVCIVTSGPGATNTITGIGDAMIDSTPIVVITGQVQTSLLGTDAFQEIDLVGITQPITKWSYQIRRVEDIAWAVARAFYIANTGRPGPVVLDFSQNAQSDKGIFSYKKCVFSRGYIPYQDIDEKQIENAAQIINNSKKPFALIGQGVILANAENELLNFLNKADIPAASTLLGLSAIPSDYRLNKGFLGIHGNIAPNIKTNECDVLIAIGMRFDNRVTGNIDTYAKQAKIIHLDVDPSEIDKNVKTYAKVLGDAKITLKLITDLLKENKHTEWINSFEEYEEKEYKEVISKELFPAENEPLKMGEVINIITEKTANNAIVVTDVGQNQMMAARYFKFNKTRSMVTSGGLGTMGFGLPAAIGAKIAAHDRTVCLIMGDGGFQMTMEELGTIMQENIGIKMVILNNKYLGMVRQLQELFFNKRYSSTSLPNPDFSLIANAYNIKNKIVNNRTELKNAISEMFCDDKPYLLIANIEEQGIVYPMTPAGQSITDIMLGEKNNIHGK